MAYIRLTETVTADRYTERCMEVGIANPTALVTDYGNLSAFFIAVLCICVEGSIVESYRIVPPIQKKISG